MSWISVLFWIVLIIVCAVTCFFVWINDDGPMWGRGAEEWGTKHIVLWSTALCCLEGFLLGILRDYSFSQKFSFWSMALGIVLPLCMLGLIKWDEALQKKKPRRT
ncbi:MAG TPA: hypothetical protein DEB09_03780 [Candidatus Magasanikbacteria bacterium]|nr:hypothetical protein [Candidatus Magasanikbacteria bacterium]